MIFIAVNERNFLLIYTSKMGKYLAIIILVFAAVPYASGQDTVVPHPYTILHYDENIRVNPADSSVVGDCNIFTLSYADTLANIRYDMVGLTVDSVLVNDAQQSFIHDSANLFVALGSVEISQTSFHGAECNEEVGTIMNE